MKRNYIDTYRWKWVCVQHPMILISGDQSEPRALETVAPWGAGSIPGYCHKMYETLKIIDDTPGVKADYDLSAAELLLFCKYEPEGKELLKKLYAEGRVGITGTDYSQTHYGTIRSESALRQIRMGAEIFEKELGIVTDTFCRQETGIFENMPQLLRAFGVRKSAAFRFPTAFEYLELPSLELLLGHGKVSFIHDETMANWCGLDGSCIPLYLPQVNTMLTEDYEGIETTKNAARPEFASLFPEPYQNPVYREYPLDEEEQKGSYRNGSVIIQVPDMAKMTPEYIEPRLKNGEFYRLTDALEEEIASVTRMPKIRYYTYWSYDEGGFGEQMYKLYRKSEEKILAAETIQALAAACGIEKKFDAYAAWEKLLLAQHHDVNWVDHTDLRSRAAGWCEEAALSALDFVKETGAAIATSLEEEKAEKAVAVFNTLPTARKALAMVPVSGTGYRVLDEKGCEVPAQVDGEALMIQAEFDGLGCRSFRLEPAEAKEEVIVQKEPYTFENEVMCVTVLPDGRLSSLYSKKNGEQLDGYGNVISGRLVYEENSYRVISNQDAAKEMTITKGNLYDKVDIQGAIEDIPYLMTIRLPHGSSSEITFDLDMTFAKHEIGDQVHDESKLNLYWDLAKKPKEILIDEPFGFAKARPNRSLLAANFLTAWDGRDGVMFQHSGMPKNWVTGHQIVTQLAWGAEIIFNRMPYWWPSLRMYDRRLDGGIHYNYAISLVENGSVPDMFAESNSRITPLIALPTTSVFAPKTILKLNGTALVPTAVEEKDGTLSVHAFEIAGRNTEISYETDLSCTGRTDVAGHKKDDEKICAPYEIFELKFQK